MSGTYRYLVMPFFEQMPTRHEAVGFACWTSREYGVDTKIVTFEADSRAEELVDTIDDKLTPPAEVVRR